MWMSVAAVAVVVVAMADVDIFQTIVYKPRVSSWWRYFDVFVQSEQIYSHSLCTWTITLVFFLLLLLIYFFVPPSPNLNNWLLFSLQKNFFYFRSIIHWFWSWFLFFFADYSPKFSLFSKKRTKTLNKQKNLVNALHFVYFFSFSPANATKMKFKKKQESQ